VALVGQDGQEGSACGHTEPPPSRLRRCGEPRRSSRIPHASGGGRTSESEARFQRRNALGVPAFAKATARPPELERYVEREAEGPGASEKKLAGRRECEFC
jgi:hypothetical protein